MGSKIYLCDSIKEHKALRENRNRICIRSLYLIVQKVIERNKEVLNRWKDIFIDERFSVTVCYVLNVCVPFKFVC